MNEMDNLADTANSEWIPPRVVLAADRIIKLGGSDQLSSRRIITAISLALDKRMEMVWRVAFQRSLRSVYKYPAKSAALNRYSRLFPELDRRVAFLEQEGDQRSIAELSTLQILRKSCTELQKEEASRIERLTPFARQEEASVRLYTFVFEAADVAGTMIQSDADNVLRVSNDKLSDLEELRELGLKSDLSEIERELRELRFHVKQFDSSPFRVERDTGDERLRGFAIAVGFRTKELFGFSLNGVIATLANVALNRSDVTDKQIREMRRNYERRSPAKSLS
jgi:hypothetical protein